MGGKNDQVSLEALIHASVATVCIAFLLGGQSQCNHSAISWIFHLNKNEYFLKFSHFAFCTVIQVAFNNIHTIKITVLFMTFYDFYHT